MLAIVEANKAGLLRPKHWLNNIIAGVIVGVVALPLAMAFAIASGAKPEQGLYTAIIAGLFVSSFGGTRAQIAGPTGAFVVVLSGITAQYGIEGLQIASLMAGFILLLLGLAKMGAVIKYIPEPVIVGFSAGIGVTIWVGQWQDFFGLPAVSAEHFHLKLLHLLQAFPQLDVASTLLAFLALFLVLFSAKIPKLSRLPGPLVALLLVTGLQLVFQFEGIKTIGNTFGGIPQGLPSFSVPSITWGEVIELIGPAFTIAMLGAIESLLSAVVADGMTGYRHNSNQELLGQGLANMVAPLFGGFAATGAIARTATNIRNGGTSPIAGIVHSLTLIAVLLILTPYAVHIPLACLAAILFVVAWNMSEPRRFVQMLRRAPRADVAILLITFSLTVFADLVVAVNIGVILATAQFLRRMAGSVEVRHSGAEELSQEIAQQSFSAPPANLAVFSVEGPLFFAAAERFEELLKQTRPEVTQVLIRLKWVPFVDITGLESLEAVIEHLQQRGIHVMLSGANDRVRGKLAKAGILALLGTANHFPTFAHALAALNNDTGGESDFAQKARAPIS